MRTQRTTNNKFITFQKRHFYSPPLALAVRAVRVHSVVVVPLFLPHAQHFPNELFFFIFYFVHFLARLLFRSHCHESLWQTHTRTHIHTHFAGTVSRTNTLYRLLVPLVSRTRKSSSTLSSLRPNSSSRRGETTPHRRDYPSPAH